jgi:hypothetical protein
MIWNIGGADSSEYFNYIRGRYLRYREDVSQDTSSDARIKNNIENLPDQYEKFFNLMSPVRYKYNNGTSGRYHTGFIA